MLFHRCVSLISIGFMTVSACDAGPPEQAAAGEFQSIDTTVLSRGVQVPVTLVIPASADAAGPVPLVVMAHGHGGSREEGGGYRLAAEAFAARGIASIRMDFAGCGDSVESFANNNLTSMLIDLQAARAFAAARPEIDNDRVGLLGYSMGGRLVALLSEMDPSYRVMATWAPAVADGAEREWTSLGPPGTYDSLREQAFRDGSVVYTTRWGTELELGYHWFIDIERTRPLGALANFEGPLLVLYGDQDDVVPPAIPEAAIAAARNSSEVVRHVVAGADHGFGFYTDIPALATEVVETTADFLQDKL